MRTYSNARERAQSTMKTKSGTYTVFRLKALQEAGMGNVEKLPYSLRVWLENLLRHQHREEVEEEAVEALLFYNPKRPTTTEVPFFPGRVLLQDLTGVPALADLAALRSAVQERGGDPSVVSPALPVDLVVDHSLQVDEHGTSRAFLHNRNREFGRNEERYAFLKWGEQALDNVGVFPPGVGIVHQVNLEHLAAGVMVDEENGERIAYPDSLVGADSHTTMINGMGVVGWGVGGIEAEACMLGLPVMTVLPEVVGVRLEGQMPDGSTATDLVLALTEWLRKHDVVGKIVEFYGEGLDHLTLPDRATVANMAPEYGATMGFFPTDDKTLHYLELTGRSEEQIDLVREYTQLQGLWRDDNANMAYSQDLAFPLASVEPALAGPKRPQDRVLLHDLKDTWRNFFAESSGGRKPQQVELALNGEDVVLEDGALAIAAITSCTNTSNPNVMMAAGLVARKARQLGLDVPPWVKTSMAPGSRVVTDYLNTSGLAEDLEALGFYTVGYGCTTCIGNSGPLAPELVEAVNDHDLFLTSVLSGNRNFEGRVSPHTRGNFLASPALVVAYALAGTVDIDLTKEPIGLSHEGTPVYLRDIWPSWSDIVEVQDIAIRREHFVTRYSQSRQGSDEWKTLAVEPSEVFPWSEASTYLHEPPFLQDASNDVPEVQNLEGARCLAVLGDFVTTDHISPAGAIPYGSPAANYLKEQGVEWADLNTYGTRRGNDQVMVRGTFGNIRLQNLMSPEHQGGYTVFWGKGSPSANKDSVQPGKVSTIYDAAMQYKEENTPLVVLAGQSYGMGSSRDWAAKGPWLLGVRAVIAESYERIHRSNLIGMGIVPLEFLPGESIQSLGLHGQETFDIALEGLSPRDTVEVVAVSPDGEQTRFQVKVRLDSSSEFLTYQHGGILPRMMRQYLTNAA